MTREELQQELRRLEERKEQEMLRHETRIAEIAEKQQQTVFQAQEQRADILMELGNVKRKANAVRVTETRDENVRYRTQCMVIENERQRLFAEYKAQLAGQKTQEA